MKYDAIVIGSGQAGNPLSQKLADHGWTVALIEKEHLGGTCINTGCTPTKTMIASAQVAHYARNAPRWGVRAKDVSVELPAIVARKDKVVQSFRSGQQHKVDQRPNLRLYRGQARFTGSHRSEEHTSELQSLAYLVCRLLLEKKKKFHMSGNRLRVDRPARHTRWWGQDDNSSNDAFSRQGRLTVSPYQRDRRARDGTQ